MGELRSLVCFWVFAVVVISGTALSSAAQHRPHRSSPNRHSYHHYVVKKLVVNSAGAAPQQIRLALGGQPSEMVVMWITDNLTNTIAQAGVKSGTYSFSAKGTVSNYTYQGYVSGTIHTAMLTGLTPLTKYYYVCGDGNTWSTEYTFTTAPKVGSNTQQGTIIGVVGDLGSTVDHSKITVAQMASDSDGLDIIMHAGDISYANGDQPIWDSWGAMIEGLSSITPWMVTAGNHESYDNFLPFKHRFAMPAKESGSNEGDMYWSVDYALMHIVAMSTEITYTSGSAQYKWAANDIANVDRSVTPWLVIMWHRPVYNSNYAHQQEAAKFLSTYEDLFHQYKVDVCISGHVHAYERTYRVYQSARNDSAPTQYFTIGDGGNKEGLAADWMFPIPEWSAFRKALYGYSRMHVYNSTHIHWTFHPNPSSLGILSSVIGDETWIVRNYPRFG